LALVFATIATPPQLIVAANLHWISTCKDAFLFKHWVKDSPIGYELILEKVQSATGWIEVPVRPNLGVTLNKKFIKNYFVRIKITKVRIEA